MKRKRPPELVPPRRAHRGQDMAISGITTKDSVTNGETANAFAEEGNVPDILSSIGLLFGNEEM